MKPKFSSMKTQFTTLPNAGRTCELPAPRPGTKPLLALLVRLLWAAVLVLPVFGAQAAVVLTSLHSFQVFPNGGGPNGLVQGSDGSFFGTTSSGGTNGGYGTVFKISATGALTSLYSFSNSNDGANPQAALVQGSDGNFYGTASSGGSNGGGTVFKISAHGTLTGLYSFGYGNDGADPQAALVQGGDGNFYGTTQYGGSDGGYGTVFKISANGVLTTLHSFTGTNDGKYPLAALVQGSDGNFYGTTSSGGTNGGFGTVFKISANGALAGLYSFRNWIGGVNPRAALVQGSDGYFYGTTSSGGSNGGYGTVFKIGANGALASLYSFSNSNDGADPQAALVQGNDGNFYGTTSSGGTNNSGTVFKISPNGALTSLYSLTGDGVNYNYPQAGLVQGSDGNFYGTTRGGGASNSTTMSSGTVFKISPAGALNSLYSFTGFKDGAPPNGLLQGSDSSFYGTTFAGGTSGDGTVFKISPSGALTSLYCFTGGNDGANPQAALVQGSDSSFYGTTSAGGTSGDGTVFKISPSGALTSLYSFTGGNDGGTPLAGLVQGSDGNFYGTTCSGGAGGGGTVFKISPSLYGAEILYAFGSVTNANGEALDGVTPLAGLAQGSDGNFYGTTSSGGSSGGCGTVFKISANGALMTLYTFGSVTNANGDALDGNGPSGLVQGSDGNFYGTTSSGGSNGGYGTVFKISPNGTLMPLYAFGSVTNANGEPLDGANPVAALVQGSDGNFYGTTSSGGSNGGYGTVFKISPSGALTSLYSFTGGNDGSGPQAALVEGSDGSFYGTTQYRGGGGAGTIFRLTTVIARPQLTIIASRANMILTWPTNASGFTLQSATNLAAQQVWTPVSPVPLVIGAQNVVINAISGTQKFYRLIQ